MLAHSMDCGRVVQGERRGMLANSIKMQGKEYSMSQEMKGEELRGWRLRALLSEQ